MEMLAYLCVSNFRTAIKKIWITFLVSLPLTASKTIIYLLESLSSQDQDYTTCLFLKCHNWTKVKVLIINPTNSNIVQI